MPTTHPISHPVTHSDTTGHQAFAQHTPAYLALSVNAHTHALEVRCSFVPAPGKQAGVAEAMALDLVNAAHKRGATVVPPGALASSTPIGRSSLQAPYSTPKNSATAPPPKCEAWPAWPWA